MTKIQSVLSDDKNDWEHRVTAVMVAFLVLGTRVYSRRDLGRGVLEVTASFAIKESGVVG